jgi:hypothetical protein
MEKKFCKNPRADAEGVSKRAHKAADVGFVRARKVGIRVVARSVD